MATYGTQAGVAQLLRALPSTSLNADATARIDNLLKVVSAWIESPEGLGRSFGTGATSETVTVETAARSTRLLLPKGIRSVASVVENPTWDGAAWTGGSTLTAATYRLDLAQRTGEYLALRRTDGGFWAGLYRVAGQWEDTDADATVPDEIAYLANYLVAELWKREQATPAGFQGPDGSAVPIRNPYKEPVVLAILDQWRSSALMVV